MTSQQRTSDDSAWFTLGTSGGPYQQTGAHQISNALTVGDDVYLFDVGNGVLRQSAKACIEPTRVRAVFISHHHPDHIADLGLVMLTHWLSPGDRKLSIHGPTGTAHLANTLSDAYRYTAATAEDSAARDIGSRFVAHDVPARPATEGLHAVYRDENVTVEAIAVDHYRSAEQWAGEVPHAIGFRVTAGDRVYAYTGDTGASPALHALAENADLLISEVVLLEDIVLDLETRFAGSPDLVERISFNMKHNHISVADIACTAKDARVGRVVLTHFVPLPTTEQRDALVTEFTAIAPGIPVAVARDLGRH